MKKVTLLFTLLGFTAVMFCQLPFKGPVEFRKKVSILDTFTTQGILNMYRTYVDSMGDTCTAGISSSFTIDDQELPGIMMYRVDSNVVNIMGSSWVYLDGDSVNVNVMATLGLGTDTTSTFMQGASGMILNTSAGPTNRLLQIGVEGGIEVNVGDGTGYSGYTTNDNATEIRSNDGSSHECVVGVAFTEVTLTSTGSTDVVLHVSSDDGGILFEGNLLPTVDGTFDIGREDNRVDTLFVKTLVVDSTTIHVGNQIIKADDNSINFVDDVHINGHLVTNVSGDLSGMMPDPVVEQIQNVEAGLFVKNTLGALNTYNDPTTAQTALGSGKPYILSTTIGIVSVLLLAITP